MRTKLSLRKSNRIFQVWEYQVSHGQLLIRSPKAPATENTSELFTNLDIICVGVRYMAIPWILRGLELKPPTSDEIQNLEFLLSEAVSPDTVMILESEGRRFSVVAASLSVVENDWDIFESPFEFRSNFRSEP